MTMQMQAIANQSVTEQQSLVLVRNLIRTAISSIAYIRHIFPEDCFSDRLLSGLSVKTLLPSSSESKLVMQWLEQGVFEALEKKYLKSLVFGMYFDPQNESTLIECYKFCISYNQDQHAVLVVRENANAADKGNGKSTKSVSNQMMTKDGIKQATIAMIRTLISLAQTLTPIPKTRYLVMKLYYYDEITPTDYEPKFFRPATEDEALAFHFKPLRLSLGSVNTPYHQFALQIRTTVDCVDKLSALAAEHRTKANFAIDEQKNQNEVEVEEQEENEDQNINNADQAKEKMKKIEEEPKK
ncbi:MAG: putative meiotic specific asynaptic protein, partial [Streblomastix strix]